MKNIKGFTLIEVLISLIVLALGMLGLAALQTLTIKNNLLAYQRGQAIQLIYDMTDRIRANNPKDPAKGIPVQPRVSANYVSTFMDPTAAQAQPSCLPTSGPSTTCTPDLIAQNDLFEWNRDLKSLLPKGQGTITAVVTGAAPNDTYVFTISVTWDSDRSGAVDANDPSFSASFQL